MEKLISKRLKELQEKENITILYACESGSRAWGFPSPDSDYDVRIMYAHKPDWYLSLNEKNDSINLPIDDELDITGWDLRKMLRLLWKSNASPMEWMQSPIIYQETNGFVNELQQLAQSCFSPIATMHHYLTMALKYRDEVTSNPEVKLKKYFYALRTNLASKWIAEKLTMPPIVFAEMFEFIDADLENRITELMALKRGENEDYLHHQEKELNQFMDVTLKECQEAAPGLPPARADSNQLDDFFIKWIKQDGANS